MALADVGRYRLLFDAYKPPRFRKGERVIYQNERSHLLEITERKLDVTLHDGELHIGWHYGGWLLDIVDEPGRAAYRRTAWSRGIASVPQGRMRPLDRIVEEYRPNQKD